MARSAHKRMPLSDPKHGIDSDSSEVEPSPDQADEFTAPKSDCLSVLVALATDFGPDVSSEDPHGFVLGRRRPLAR